MDPSKPGSADQSNQQIPTSVFSFDPYPPSPAVNWNQVNPFANPVQLSNPDAFPGQPQTSSGGAFSPGPSTLSQRSATSIRTAVNPVLDRRSTSRMAPFVYPKTTFAFGSSRLPHEIVHFPFQITHVENKKRDFRFKRKTDSPPLQPLKQHITEEKMADHMSRLHISSETASSIETSSDQVQRLYMCEEMRKFQCDSILPQRIVSLIQKPCTALVLWKPPVRLVPNFDDGDSEQNENNTESASDVNAMDNEDDETGMSNMDMDNC